ncbi:hypothetical protein ABTN34_18355, partial [Acinetobacter baumannii]
TGYGYFWGMLFGLIASTLILLFKNNILQCLNLSGAVPDIYLFPFVLLFSFLGCILGTYVKPLENKAQVIEFYKQTKPWGFWGP